MYLKNLSNVIYEIEDKNINKFLDRGFKIATEQEIETYLYYSTKRKGGIHFVTTTVKEDGYGMASSSLEQEFFKNDILLNRKAFNADNALIFTVPIQSYRTNAHNRILYTMFESTTIPDSWLKSFEKVSKVIVPTTFCQKAFATKGIETEVVPLGYNYNAFNFLDRTRTDEPFTFLHYDAFNYRKGFDLVFEAFNRAFKGNMKVKLIMKTVRDFMPVTYPKSIYPNIEVIKGRYPIEELKEILRKSDCFVFPSRGEGMGLTPLEALATGIPAIITVGSGMADYYDAKYFLGVKKVKEIPAVYNQYKGESVGKMVEADIDEIKDKMIYAYENKDKIKKMGQSGAKWARENWGIDRTVRELKPIFKEIYGEIKN